MFKRLHPDLYKKVVALYKAGNSSQEIKEKLGLKQCVRQVQRWIKEEGITRETSEAFKLAIRKGRVRYYTSSVKKSRKTLGLKTRMMVFERDGMACVLCGKTARDTVRLEVDHIDEDPTNNKLSNLQVLCSECNKGKYLVGKEKRGL